MRLQPWLFALAIAAALGFVAPAMDAYFLSILLLAGVNIILALSLNLINGFTGQFSMGHAGFMCVGAYVSAYLSLLLREWSPGIWEGWAGQLLLFPALTVLGGLVAAAAGYLVGLPSLRLRGDYLAIVTLGFGEIIRVILLNMQAVGGARGLPDIPPLAGLGWIYVWVVITLFTLWRLLRSPQGRSFVAVREDEIAANAMGVNTTSAKVRAFVIGAFFAGVAGALFAHYLRYLNPQTFDFNRSFEVIIMVVLGGMGSLSGSVLAAVLLTFLREALRPLQELTGVDLRMIIYSLLLIVMMFTKPNGFMGTMEVQQAWARLQLKFRRKGAGA